MKNQANTKQKIEMQEEKMIKERDIAALAAWKIIIKKKIKMKNQANTK